MRASGNFILREIAGEYLLVPTGAAAASMNGLVTMNELGCFIFKALAREQTEETLLQAILAEYDVQREEALADLREYLQQLRQLGALVEAAHD